MRHIKHQSHQNQLSAPVSAPSTTIVMCVTVCVSVYTHKYMCVCFVPQFNKKFSALAITHIKQALQRFNSTPSTATKKGEKWEGERTKCTSKRSISLDICVCVFDGRCVWLYILLRFRKEKKEKFYLSVATVLPRQRRNSNMEINTHERPLTPSCLQCKCTVWQSPVLQSIV